MMLNRLIPSMLLLVGITLPVPAFDPLERVEQDQAAGEVSSHTIFNRNLALNTLREYTQVSSYKPGAFGFYAHDGDDRTHWVTGPEQSGGWLEISWGLAQPVNTVVVTEKGSESIRSLTLELYDGTKWDTVMPDRPQARNRFSFPTRPASALRVTIDTGSESAGITEVEVYNTGDSSPLSRYGSAPLIQAMQNSDAVMLFDGSPYGFSRHGRSLIQPRNPEACLADRWTVPVLEYVVSSLGGATETGEVGRLNVRLNENAFELKTSSDSRVIEQIKLLAEQAGLEFSRHGALVMIGHHLDTLKDENLIAELSGMLGVNPYHVEGKSNEKADAVITPSLNQDGITYEWAGFRGMAESDTNADAWFKYSGTKANRTWIGAPRYMNRYVRPEKKIETEEEFEALKRQIRAAPETNKVIALQAFRNKFHDELSAEFGMYNQLGIEIINATGPKDWPDTLHDDFINWAGCYALTYYLAKNFGVAAHQYGNEPDWYFNKSTDEQIARRLTLVADAVHGAIEDVNRDGNLNLRAVYAAPVLAGDFTGRSARIMMRNLYTRYDGSRSPTPLFQLFNRHRYSGRPHQNAMEVRTAKEVMLEEAGEILPQVFTELNYSTGRNWARPTTTFINDTPTVFTSIASIWGWMMQAQGVYGIFVFKMNDPGAWFWENRGPFSNVITYSMDPEQDPGADPKVPQQISYGTKNFEVCRLFGRGFHGSRPLLQTDIECSDPQYRSWTTFGEAEDRFYIWSVQVNDFEAYELEFDLSRLDLPPGALVTAEVVSGARHGEVTHVMTLPEDGKIRIHQAPQSAMLLTVHKRPLEQQTLYPEADATVIQGDQAQTNFGGESWLRVGRDASNGSNRISFLKFKLPGGAADVQRAVLELHGQSSNTHAYDGGFLFRVYAVEKAEWDEFGITAENAPHVYRTVSGLEKIDLHNYPVGHVTSFNAPSILRVDITRAVQEALATGRETLDLVLIREVYWPEENTDAVSAILSSREAGPEQSPKVHLWK